jgi:hypothetical protein
VSLATCRNRPPSAWPNPDPAPLDLTCRPAPCRGPTSGERAVAGGCCSPSSRGRPPRGGAGPGLGNRARATSGLQVTRAGDRPGDPDTAQAPAAGAGRGGGRPGNGRVRRSRGTGSDAPRVLVHGASRPRGAHRARVRRGDTLPAGRGGRLARDAVGIVSTATMAAVAWLTVLSGTWIVYPRYRPSSQPGRGPEQVPEAGLTADPQLSFLAHLRHGVEGAHRLDHAVPRDRRRLRGVAPRQGRDGRPAPAWP